MIQNIQYRRRIVTSSAVEEVATLVKELNKLDSKSDVGLEEPKRQYATVINEDLRETQEVSDKATDLQAFLAG
jgi:hypothetical protein